MTAEEFEKMTKDLEILAKPLRAYLATNGNPYTKIEITPTATKVVETKLCIPYERNS